MLGACEGGNGRVKWQEGRIRGSELVGDVEMEELELELDRERDSVDEVEVAEEALL